MDISISEEVNNLLNTMTEAEQLEYYIKSYNESRDYYKETILRLMETTQCDERDDLLNTIFEEIIQLDKTLNEILQME